MPLYICAALSLSKGAALFAVACVFLSSCNLLTGKPKTDLMAEVEDSVAYSKAAWVPLTLNAGKLGTITPVGAQNGFVKNGYSSARGGGTVTFTPSAAYPFHGWVAWVKTGEGNKAVASYYIPDAATYDAADSTTYEIDAGISGGGGGNLHPDDEKRADGDDYGAFRARGRGNAVRRALRRGC
jgi:hypothetical protein